MSDNGAGPFSNSTDGEMFTLNRCARCVHRDTDADPCDAFTPAYFGEWPSILRKVERTEANPVGVECDRFTADPPEPAAEMAPEPAATYFGGEDVAEVPPELADCWLPQQRRWRAVKAGENRRDVLFMGGQLYQVEWINHGSQWRKAGRPQAKVVGFKAFDIDLDEEVTVLVPTTERNALGVVGERMPNAFAIEDCSQHDHTPNEEGAA